LGNAAVMGGYLNGDMRMEGSFAAPVLDGEISLDSVTAHIPAAGARLRFGKDRLTVTGNVIDIRDFDIFGANDNPLTLSGRIDAKKFSDILFDLEARANNFQLIKSDKRSKDDIFGKVFLNLNATVKGPMRLLDVNGNVNVLGTTDATYRLNMDPAELSSKSEQDVVRFVNFSDTTQVAREDTVVDSPLNMRINANLVVSPGTHVEVILSDNGTNKVELDPTANLNYFQNYMGDMSLTGTLTLGNGYARYALPVLGEKMFTFDPSSTLTWTGSIMNPTLNVTATDDVKANVTSGGNARLVNFLVTLRATSTLQNLKVAFDLATNDDLAIQNELQSMSADQRQTQAMNLLLYNQYSAQGTKASAASGNMLYSFLESQLNSWAAKNIRGVDLSFGVNQYDKTTDGVTNTETSYSYQVSKSLFNNRFKILVGGNYSTDSADEEIAQNLVSDVAFEYLLKQTQTINMSVRLFRHTGYESILEGEITEMGAGFVFKRHLENLKSLFRFRRRKKKAQPERTVADTLMPRITDSVATPDNAETLKKED
ncbi:MAG: translocation/assembly module TamB, partial [Muribaculaceae bacterium]|nr:translocation/assembly module TamB [Muribaculaceae bacterium]